MPRGGSDENPDIAMTGPLLALAYPDRIGRRRPGTAGRYLLSGGRGAALPEGDPMANEEGLAQFTASERAALIEFDSYMWSLPPEPKCSWLATAGCWRKTAS